MSQVLREAVNESFASGLAPEAMLTVADNHWNEVARVTRLHKCESLLLGFHNIVDQSRAPGFNELVTDVFCDVVFLRFPPGWKFLASHRILIPVGGRGMHGRLRARLLGNLRRQVELDVTYLCLTNKTAESADITRMRRLLTIRAEDEMGGERATVVVEQCDNPASGIVERSKDYDLVIVGLQESNDRRRAISDFTLRIANSTECALIIIGQKRDEPAIKLPDFLRVDAPS